MDERALFEQWRASLGVAPMQSLTDQFAWEVWQAARKTLLDAAFVDVDISVQDRDYTSMTPKDCYEAGLLDGSYATREAIKQAMGVLPK
jgi:hypothetical protein